MSDQPKSGKVTGSGNASKDNTQLKRNAHIDVSLPDRKKDAEDQERARQLVAQRKSKPTRPRGRYTERDRERVIEQRRRGLTTPQIAKIKGLPTSSTIYNWLDDDPAFADAYETAYDGYVDEQAQAVVPLIDEIAKLPALKDSYLRDADKLETIEDSTLQNGLYRKLMAYARRSDIELAALNTRIGRSLQAASQRTPDKWGKTRESGENVILFEVGMKWESQPKSALPNDPDGQGEEAQAARDRWNNMRDVTP